MKSKKNYMSHGSAQWCHRANTMDNLRTAVVKQLNRQKVMQTPGETQGTMYHTSVHNGATWQIRLHILHEALLSLWNNANRILK